jgi:predicted DNA-binding transcriptional regulator AlpA
MKTRAKAKPKAGKPSSAVAIPPGVAVALERRQIAAALGVTTKTLGQMVSSGEYPGPDFHIGRLPRWRAETHNAWMAGKNGVSV